MRALAILWRKEVTALFSSAIAYVVVTVFLLTMGYSFTLTLFVTHSTTLVYLFFQMFVLFMLTVPILTMRLVAEERKLRTIEMLLIAPISEAQVVLAKFAASMTLVAVILLLSLAYPIVLALYAEPDWGPIWSGYLGLVLLASALVGTGLLTSTLAANQIVAAVAALGIFLLLWIIDDFGHLLPDPFDALVADLSLSAHFKPFATGSLYLSDVAFFVTAALLTLFLSIRALSWR
jgi:ABC-2 type transport system permease protein